MSDIESIARQIENVPVGEVTPIVRKAVGDDSALVEPGWTAEVVGAPSAGEATIGFVRVNGSASTGKARASWVSMVKILDTRSGYEDRQGRTGARGELAALRSPELAGLQGPLKAAEVLAVVPIEDDATAVWMMDLAGTSEPPWDVETYIRVSRHVGRFNAMWPAESAPAGDWVSLDTALTRANTLIDNVAPR